MVAVEDRIAYELFSLRQPVENRPLAFRQKRLAQLLVRRLERRPVGLNLSVLGLDFEHDRYQVHHVTPPYAFIFSFIRAFSHGIDLKP